MKELKRVLLVLAVTDMAGPEIPRQPDPAQHDTKELTHVLLVLLGWYEDSRTARPYITHRNMSTHVGYYVFCQSQASLVRKHQGSQTLHNATRKSSSVYYLFSQSRAWLVGKHEGCQTLYGTKELTHVLLEIFVLRF